MMNNTFHLIMTLWIKKINPRVCKFIQKRILINLILQMTIFFVKLIFLRRSHSDKEIWKPVWISKIKWLKIGSGVILYIAFVEQKLIHSSIFLSRKKFSKLKNFQITDPCSVTRMLYVVPFVKLLRHPYTVIFVIWIFVKITY